MSLRSPFARRVRVALTRLGIEHEEEMVDVFNPPSHFLSVNPLGLVPTLVGADGFVLSDSNMIIEWAHSQTGQVWPQGQSEWAIRQASVLCTGLMTSTVLFFQETKMHDAPSNWWANDHHSVIVETLAVIEGMGRENFLVGAPTQLTQAGWDLAIALEYLTIRLPTYPWVDRHIGFNEIVEMAHRNQKFSETVPKL